MRRVIEVDEIAGAYVDGAHAEPHLATAIDAVKVHRPLKRGLQERDIVSP